jgi:hypothetical protein
MQRKDDIIQLHWVYPPWMLSKILILHTQGKTNHINSSQHYYRLTSNGRQDVLCCKQAGEKQKQTVQ